MGRVSVRFADRRAEFNRLVINRAVRPLSGRVVLSGASQSGLAVCNLLSGLAVALLAVGFTSAYSRTHGMAFVAPLLGLWMIVSPWLVVGVTTTAGMIWSNVVCGIIVCLLGLGLTAMGMADGGMRMRRR